MYECVYNSHLHYVHTGSYSRKNQQYLDQLLCKLTQLLNMQHIES